MAGALGIVVFARLDSRRLPGKALLPLAGRPLLGRVLDRVRRVKAPCIPIVATSDRAIDDRIATFAGSEGVRVFRGSANDVAGRALACAHQNDLGDFVRISGDSPFFSPALVDQMIELHLRHRPDITTNLHPRTFPPGNSVEVVSTSAMERMLAMPLREDDREHVTQYFYRHPAAFTIRNVAAEKPSAGSAHLAVDTPADLARAAWIVTELGPNAASAEVPQILALAAQWPGANNVVTEGSSP